MFALRQGRRAPSTEMVAHQRAPPGMHVPVDAAAAARLGHPRCAFVTGGPREYLPGINCIGHQLDALGSRYPLLVMAEEAQEAFMRRHVVLSSHPSSVSTPNRSIKSIHPNVSIIRHWSLL